MPIRPPDLVHIAQAAGNIEYGFYKIVQFPVPVSPGQTSLLEMVPEKGRSIVIEGDLLAWVDTYLAGITVPAFYLNGRQILQAQLPYIFAGATAFSGGQYVIVGEEGMVAEFYNPSDYQATVWIAAEAAHLDNDWVNKKLVPAMDVGYYETLRVVGAA